MYKTIATDKFLQTLDKSNPSIFFDVDHTVIYPAKGKKMYSAKDNFQWVPHPNAKIFIKDAIKTGFTVYFVTNQLKYDTIVEKRLYEMLRYLDIEALILIADQRNIYRKPSAKLIQEINIPGGIPTIVENVSFHCGDAGGRSSDFSDDDLWFARSANIKFYFPEEVFDNFCDSSWKKIKETPLIPPPVDKSLIQILKKYYAEEDGIMLIGLPGSGKSSIRKWMVENLHGRPIYVYNNDEKLYFPTDNPPGFYIFDNTNLTEFHRKMYVGSLNLKTIYIDISAKEAIRGVKYRNIFHNGVHIPDVVIHTMNSRKEIPLKVNIHLTHRPILTSNYPPFLN